MSKRTRAELESEIAELRSRVEQQSAVIAKLVAAPVAAPAPPWWLAPPAPVYVPVPCGRPHADNYPWQVVPYAPPYPTYPVWPSPLPSPWWQVADGVTYTTIVGDTVLIPNNAGCAANPMLGAQVVTLTTDHYSGPGAVVAGASTFDWPAPAASGLASSTLCFSTTSSPGAA